MGGSSFAGRHICTVSGRSDIEQPRCVVPEDVLDLSVGEALGPAGPFEAAQVLEADEDGQRVYLPRYGWPAMDDAAQDAWAALGFATRPIDGLTISAMYGGALRCAVKVLARG